MSANAEIIAELRRVLHERDEARERNTDLRTILEQVTRERDSYQRQLDAIGDAIVPALVQRIEPRLSRHPVTVIMAAGSLIAKIGEAIGCKFEDGDDLLEAVKELVRECNQARTLVDQLGTTRDKAEAELRDLQRSTSEALAQAVEWKRERDEWRDKYYALDQTAGELCESCGWAFKIPGEPCRCEVVRERDEARARVETVTASRDKAEDTIISLIDRVAWYRNLAISLGARPSQMLSANDRWLCEKEGAPRDYISAQSVELEDLWARNDRLVEDCRELRDRIKLVRGSFMGDVNERWLEMLNRAESERAEAVDMRMRLLTNPFLRKDADQRTREQEIEYLKYERDSARTVANNAVEEINALTAARCADEQAISEAYRRGAEAMREACARWMSEREGISQWVYDDALSTLPIPGEP
jgi:chromosome segregation ATPase